MLVWMCESSGAGHVNALGWWSCGLQTIYDICTWAFMVAWGALTASPFSHQTSLGVHGVHHIVTCWVGGAWPLDRLFMVVAKQPELDTHQIGHVHSLMFGLSMALQAA